MKSTDRSAFDFTPATGGQAPVPLGPPEANALAAEAVASYADTLPTEATAPLENAAPTEATAPLENAPPTEATAPHENAPPAPYRGGPRTEEGKRNARGNALKHGLTAKTRLPEVLDPGRLDWYVQAFTAEYQPQTATEHVLVQSIAQHATALERIGSMETALLRRGAAAPAIRLEELGEPMPGPEILSSEEIALAAAAGSDEIEKLTRYRVSHEKGFDAAVEALEKCQNRRAARAAGPVPASPALAAPTACAARFPTEDACRQYLSAWARQQPFRCPNCDHDEATWLAAQQRRQCTACRRQVGVRDGTVMANSHVSLPEWFRAIERLVHQPDAKPAEVARAAGIARRETAGRMAKKIRDALASPEASQRLAGLDEVFGRPAAGAPPTSLLDEADDEGPFCETNGFAPSAPDPPGRP